MLAGYNLVDQDASNYTWGPTAAGDRVTPRRAAAMRMSAERGEVAPGRRNWVHRVTGLRRGVRRTGRTTARPAYRLRVEWIKARR